MTSEKYQEIFNSKLKEIRRICNLLENPKFGDSIIGIMFDFSDELKSNGLVTGDTDDDNENSKR